MPLGSLSREADAVPGDNLGPPFAVFGIVGGAELLEDADKGAGGGAGSGVVNDSDEGRVGEREDALAAWDAVLATFRPPGAGASTAAWHLNFRMSAE